MSTWTITQIQLSGLEKPLRLHNFGMSLRPQAFEVYVTGGNTMEFDTDTADHFKERIQLEKSRKSKYSIQSIILTRSKK